MKYALTLCLFLSAALLLHAQPGSGLQRASTDSVRGITKIAFGSSNNQNLPQEMWLNMLDERPDLFIFLGNAITPGSENAQDLADKYGKQLGKTYYQSFLERVPVIGTWDGNEYVADSLLPESSRLFLDFIGEPKTSPRRTQKGIYTSYVFGMPGKQVKIILLDTRTFRQEPGIGADMLGEAQWQWLREELRNSASQVHIIATATQFLSDKDGYDDWSKDFPAAAMRMNRLLDQSGKEGILFISGGLRCAEIMKDTATARPYPLHEFTAGGISDAGTGKKIRTNSYRTGDPFCKLNFGLITIQWGEPASVKVEIRDIQNFTDQEITIFLEDLRPH